MRGAIDLKEVTLAFGQGPNAVIALQKLSLSLRPGDFLSVLGPSGCGKSSRISAIAGFQPPQAGEIRVDGEPVLKPGSDRGVVFQQPTLFPWKTVRDNVDFGLKVRGISRRNARRLQQKFFKRSAFRNSVGTIPPSCPAGCSSASD